MTTQTDLAAVKAKIEQNHKDRDAVVENHAALYTEQLALEARLAEEQKPKLRDGDYGPDKDGQSSIALASGGGKFCYYQRGANSNHPGYRPVIILGNIFDDLEASQGEETEFTMDNRVHDRKIRVRIWDGTIDFRISDGYNHHYCTIPVESISKFILKLRQMVATLKRRQK